ncbi:Unsaturated glucuronyl hydrolase [Termitomyces sp. J132]|nr:Unsaturated glucuronyl hydrolase [Termitomyces sp. J132]
MRQLAALILLIPLLGAFATPSIPTQLYSSLVPTKVLATYNSLPKPIQYPQYTTTTGTWLYFPPDTWTSGFFPATLYALNSRKAVCPPTAANALGLADWVTLGRSASTGLVPLEAGNNQGHDQGFLSFPFAEELEINPSNTTAQNAIKAFSKILAARFNPIVGCTRSWDSADPNDFQVIIDNMMNLDLLLKHNHIRDDGSTWHVVEYNSTTGVVIRKRTEQGFADNSTWSRGQAWGIYGFANMYKRTSKVDYLVTARRLAKYFLDNIPADGIVPWDFDAPLIPAPRPADSSAATIASMGLLLLAQVETDPDNAVFYTDSAINITNAITSLAFNEPWQSILSNGTVNKPANNFLTGITYGDYYYIKVGTELVSRGLVNCTSRR